MDVQFSDPVEVAIEEILLEGDSQARDGCCDKTIAKYAEQMSEGVEFPPVSLFRGSGDYHCIGDGFHRVQAAQLSGKDVIAAKVASSGDPRRDAQIYGCGANARHGLPPRPNDKRRSVDLLLADPEWSDKSDRAIARYAGVSHTFVANRRKLIARHSVTTRWGKLRTRTEDALPEVLEPGLTHVFWLSPRSLEGGTEFVYSVEFGWDGELREWYIAYSWHHPTLLDDEGDRAGYYAVPKLYLAPPDRGSFGDGYKDILHGIANYFSHDDTSHPKFSAKDDIEVTRRLVSECPAVFANSEKYKSYGRYLDSIGATAYGKMLLRRAVEEAREKREKKRKEREEKESEDGAADF